MKNIRIISGPMQSGKTSRLMQEYAGRTDTGGILAPDLNGLRMLFNLRSGEYYPFQTHDPQPGDLSIGRFHFKKEAFELARQILLNELLLGPKYLVIDEAGKLEVLQHKGLEPALNQVIAWYQDNELESELVLVVRDELLEEAGLKYKI